MHFMQNTVISFPPYGEQTRHEHGQFFYLKAEVEVETEKKNFSRDWDWGWQKLKFEYTWDRVWIQKKSWNIIKTEIQNAEKLLYLNETCIVSKDFHQEQARLIWRPVSSMPIHLRLGSQVGSGISNLSRLALSLIFFPEYWQGWDQDYFYQG